MRLLGGMHSIHKEHCIVASEHASHLLEYIIDPHSMHRILVLSASQNALPHTSVEVHRPDLPPQDWFGVVSLSLHDTRPPQAKSPSSARMGLQGRRILLYFLSSKLLHELSKVLFCLAPTTVETRSKQMIISLIMPTILRPP